MLLLSYDLLKYITIRILNKDIILNLVLYFEKNIW